MKYLTGLIYNQEDSEFGYELERSKQLGDLDHIDVLDPLSITNYSHLKKIVFDYTKLKLRKVLVMHTFSVYCIFAILAWIYALEFLEIGDFY